MWWRSFEINQSNFFSISHLPQNYKLKISTYCSYLARFKALMCSRRGRKQLVGARFVYRRLTIWPCTICVKLIKKLLFVLTYLSPVIIVGGRLCQASLREFDETFVVIFENGERWKFGSVFFEFELLRSQ